MVVATLSASADAYNYLNFVKADAMSGNSFSTTSLKITFNGTNANVSSDGQTTTLAMSNFGYLEFSNTKLDTLPTWLRGDVNGDGLVDINDINCLINVVLGNTPADAYEGRAYVNEDTEVDVADISEVITIIMGS